MDFGGWSTFLQCPGTVCDGMPSPDTPGWTLSTDSHGCKVWQLPPSTGPVCGSLPPDAAPPPPICPTPADVSSFTPPAFTPPVVHKGACTSQQIQDLYTACFSGSSTQCSTFTQANQTCASCVMTTPQSPGPLVAVSTGIIELNIAGCVAIVTGDSSSTSCAARIQANQDCEGAACNAQCPVSDSQSFQDYQKCIQTAEAGGCSKYAQAECALDAGASAQCTGFVAFQTGYDYMAPLFCGP